MIKIAGRRTWPELVQLADTLVDDFANDNDENTQLNRIQIKPNVVNQEATTCNNHIHPLQTPQYNSKYQTNFNVRCYNCGGLGHIQSKCPSARRQFNVPNRYRNTDSPTRDNNYWRNRSQQQTHNSIQPRQYQYHTGNRQQKQPPQNQDTSKTANNKFERNVGSVSNNMQTTYQQ